MSCNFLSGHHFVNNILIFNKFMSLSKATNAPKYVGTNIFKLSTPAFIPYFADKRTAGASLQEQKIRLKGGFYHYWSD